MISWTYFVSLIALLNFQNVFGDENVATEIPPIWPAITTDKSYKIMYELQMFQTSERVTVEEWASFDKQLFRFDLITSETRITYLTNGETNEVFRFKPFVCEQLSADSKELGIIANLFKGYSLSKGSNSSTMAYGLGPLWLRAKQDSTKVTVLHSEDDDFRRHRFLKHYNGYEVSFERAELSYNLRLYFSQETSRFLRIVEWVNSENTTQVANTNNVEARARVMYVDRNPIDDSIFELPLGYGCEREAKFDLHDNDVRLDLLHDGTSNQAVLEVTTSRPKDELLNSWMSQRFTINLLRGSLRLNEQLHTYYVTLTQQINPKTSRLQRIKRVWSALNSFNKTAESTVYTIEETNGECTVGRTKFRDLVKLPFPTGKKEMAPESPMIVNMDLITSLFNDASGYHQLREKVSATKVPGASSFREVFYEKRVDNFEFMKDYGNQMVMPVSIVKRVKGLTITLDNPNSMPLVSNYHTMVTIFFYNADFSKILFKAVFDLLGTDELDISFLHKKLDIGSCFSESQKEDILIKYPMESQEFSSKLSAINDLVRDRFLVNLFGTTPLQLTQVSGIELSFDNFFMYIKMTLIDLPLKQTFELKEAFELVRRANESLTTRSALIEKISSSLDKCADSCDYYGCFRFSYDHYKYECKIELKDGVASVAPNFSSDLYQYVKYSINSAWAKYDETGGRAHLRPSTILELFRELIVYESPEDNNARSGGQEEDSAMPYENVPLRIYLDTELLSAVDPTRTEFIELKPISVHSDMDSVNEFVKEEEEEQQSNYTSIKEKEENSIVRVYEGSKLQIQYTILMEGKQFNQNSGIQELEDMSYDDCAELCESNDCRSFSYCEFKRACLVTNLHKTADIKRATKDNPLCSVHALDYLSKFEDFGWVQTPAVVKSVIEGTSKEDCANVCMEEEGFNCQGFYHCSKYDSIKGTRHETISCLLQDKHIEEVDPSDRSSPKFRARLLMMKDDSTYDCRYFARSYLSQFDEYLGKGLKSKELPAGNGASPPPQPPIVTEVVVGLGAENCAKLCIQESCLAFHVCLDPIDHNRVCSLAKSQVRKDSLVPKKRCTTFVLSDKSQFNIKRTKLIMGEPDRKALAKDTHAPDVVIDPEQKDKLEKDANANLFSWFWELDEVRQIKEGSNFMAKLMSFLFGSLVGVICAIAWLQRNSIYNITTRVGSYYRARS